MKKINVAAVSYLNTVPFIYGIENSSIKEFINLKIETPAKCAQLLIKDSVDIALIPVGALPQLRNYKIISEYGIGCDGAVNSVMLYSSIPIESVNSILLDYQSVTSVNLIRILCNKYWKVNPHFLDAETGFENDIKNDVAGVVIGDRTFLMNEKFNYVYDLGKYWKEFTGLPFVFACWVSNKNLNPTFIEQFNNALQSGIDDLTSIAATIDTTKFNHIDIHEYYTRYLSFRLTESHKKGMNLFLSYLEKLS